MPSGRTACPYITDNKDGTVTVKYSPTERGLHEMEIKYDGSHIPGNLSRVQVRVVPPNNRTLISDSQVLRLA